MVFNKPPGKPSEDEIHVTNVELLHDPMIPASAGLNYEPKRREDVIAMIHSKLPDEYLHLVSESKGIRVNDWAVSGIHDIRKVVLQDGNYYLLGEKDSMGAVGIREDEFSGQVYYLDYGDNRGEKITMGLRKFFEEFDGGKVVGRF